MEEQRMDTPETELPVEDNQKPVYRPRPWWQLALAWVGAAIMILCVILYYWHIANGGL